MCVCVREREIERERGEEEGEKKLPLSLRLISGSSGARFPRVPHFQISYLFGFKYRTFIFLHVICMQLIKPGCCFLGRMCSVCIYPYHHSSLCLSPSLSLLLTYELYGESVCVFKKKKSRRKLRRESECVCICVCVCCRKIQREEERKCVCMREKERARERRMREGF